MGVEGVKWEDEGMSWVELRILEISGVLLIYFKIIKYVLNA